MDKVGLVLVGGGMRGVYTSGVPDFFMEQNLYFIGLHLSITIHFMPLKWNV